MHHGIIVSTNIVTVESRFFKPLRKKKVGSKNQEVQEIKDRNVLVLEQGRKVTSGSSYQKNQGFKN